MLEKDPLLQVLYVPANDDYSRNEVNLSADNLKIVVVPADYDDRSSEKLMAFDRWGHQIEYDPRDEQSPLVVVGRNERLEYIKGAASQDAEVYMRVDNGYYRDRLIYREIEKPDDPGFGRGLLPVEPSLPNLKSAPVKREILKTSENIAQARFTSTKAMRRYEARVLGKPEVQYNAQMVGLTSGTIAGKEWKDGAWVSINSEVGYWSPLHKALVDCYTIEWVEIDNLGHSIELNVTSIVGGVALTGRVSLTYGDDRIGSQCIYFESEIDNLGYRTYSLGDTFQFSIRVKQKSE